MAHVLATDQYKY